MVGSRSARSAVVGLRVFPSSATFFLSFIFPSLCESTKSTSFKLPSDESASFELQQNQATQQRIEQSGFYKFLLCLWVKIV